MGTHANATRSHDTSTVRYPTYVRVPLRLSPTRRVDHNAVAYQVGMPNGDLAMLHHIVDTGWDMVIVAEGVETRRGLFATLHDAIMVLLAESNQQLLSRAW